MVLRNSNKRICAICGSQEPTTKDHVPPRGIFDKPRPSDLITVPSCKTCNNGDSHHDELFKIYIGLQVGRNGSNQKNIVREAIHSAKKNSKIRRTILRNTKLKDIITETGIFTGEKVYSSKWSDKANIAHEKVIKRTVKGLYYHHFNKCLNAEIETYWFDQPPQLNQEFFKSQSIGNGKFIYLFTNVHDEEMATVWLFQFYGAHWAGAITTPIHN